MEARSLCASLAKRAKHNTGLGLDLRPLQKALMQSRKETRDAKTQSRKEAQRKRLRLCVKIFCLFAAEPDLELLLKGWCMAETVG